jgi:hypothetical protein
MQFDFQKLGKDNVEAAMASLGAVSKGAQAAAVEMASFAKSSFERGSAAAEKLAGVRTLDKAVEIQTDYLKSSYESLVAQASKLGELYANVAREAYAPVETMLARPAQA